MSRVPGHWGGTSLRTRNTSRCARIKAKVTHLKSGHEVMLTKPKEVADMIL